MPQVSEQRIALTWEQKFAAILALTGHFSACLRMRKPGDWYVADDKIEVKDGSMLISASGNGPTPAEAVIDWWANHVTLLKPEQYLIIHAYMPARRAVRWNGFMWETIAEKESDNA